MTGHYKTFLTLTSTFVVLTPCEDCTVEVMTCAAAAVELDVVALAVTVTCPGGDAGDARLRPEPLRDMTLTNAYSMSDEKTKTRQTIIHMSIACHRTSPYSTLYRLGQIKRCCLDTLYIHVPANAPEQNTGKCFARDRGKSCARSWSGSGKWSGRGPKTG